MAEIAASNRTRHVRPRLVHQATFEQEMQIAWVRYWDQCARFTIWLFNPAGGYPPSILHPDRPDLHSVDRQPTT